jgi:Trypsin-like peptidase domain
VNREHESVAEELLASCSALLRTDAGPRGTAFFVAPGYAITAAHVVDGAEGLAVQLTERSRTWCGRVTAVHPSGAGTAGDTATYPAPDLALITIEDGPAHACALLGQELPEPNAWLMVRGYTRTFDRVSVTAETETFRRSGMVDTSDPRYRLLKLGQGEVTKGMSGGPVLELSTGQVAGMLRTARQPGSNLGGWVVPAGLIRGLWPEEIGRGNDLFHHQDPSWQQRAALLRTGPRRAGPPASGNAPAPEGLSIETVRADVMQIITGGQIGEINIDHHGRRSEPETR